MHTRIASKEQVRAAETERYMRRADSAAIALGVGILAAAVSTMLMGQPIGFAGVPVAGFLGWFLALRIDGGRFAPIKPILGMAFGCAVIGAYVVALIASMDPVWTIVLGTTGLILLGLPVFILLLVPATAWAVTTSWLLRGAATTSD
jgi:hypothetical protein